MLSCKDITEQANEYLECELPLVKRLKFRMHLFMCVHCNRYVQQLNTTIESLKRYKTDSDVDEKSKQNIVDLLKQHNFDDDPTEDK